MKMRSILATTAMLALALIVGAVQNASASSIAVVADVNASGSGNFSFYDAILGSSQDVLFSRSVAQQGLILQHYDLLAGVTATANGATLTAALLATIDMLVVTVVFGGALNYSAAEIASVAGFAASGGTVLMITEASNPNTAGYNNFLSGIGSLISYTGSRFGGQELNIVAEATSLGALDPFDVNAYNTLSGGTAVYIANNGTVVAFEDTTATVPEPSTLLMLGAGLAGLAGWRWRKDRVATS